MHRTQQIVVKKGHRLYNYFQGMCHNAKNMHNTTNFYIRQVYTALTQDKPLQPLQKEVLDSIEKYIDGMNDGQLLAFQKKKDKELTKLKKDRKEIKCNLFDAPTKDKPYVDYNFLDALFKKMSQQDYRSLPAQSSQNTMKDVFQNWKSFFEANKDYKINPKKYKGKPQIPGYSYANEKEMIITNQDCVIKEQKYLKFPKTKTQLNIGKLGKVDGKLKEVRVIPKYGHYVVELVMTVASNQEEIENYERFMSIDIGIGNLAAITTNTGMEPVLLKGKNIKSINQYYNKEKAHYMGILRQGKKSNEGQFTSKRLENLCEIRFFKIKDIFHKASHFVEQLALREQIDTLIIGQNKDWKQNVNMGKKNNQSFTSIPHSMFINMVRYKAEAHGIKVHVVEESYTSKASFVDHDFIPSYEKGAKGKHEFSGKRIKRGLYRTKRQLILNADVNGSANILKKAYLKLKETTFFNIETVHIWQPRTVII